MNTPEVACFAYKRPIIEAGAVIDNDGNMPGLTILVDELAIRGIRSVASESAESAFSEDGLHIRDLRLPFAAELISYRDVGLLLNRFDRSFRYDAMSPDAHGIPAVNPNVVRSLAFRKEEMYRRILEPIGGGISTSSFTTDGFERMVSDYPDTQRFVIKPNSGTNNKGVRIVEKEIAAEQSRTNTGNVSEIIQPAYDFSIPFPEDVLPYYKTGDTAEKARSLSKERISKEVRVYMFKSPSGVGLFPVARTVNGGDEWFFVDPQSPGLVWPIVQAAAAAEKITSELAVPALYGTYDCGYGACTDGEDPTWQGIEINARWPHMIGPDRNIDVARKLRKLCADMIADTIRPGGK